MAMTEPNLPSSQHADAQAIQPMTFAQVTELLDVAPSTLRRWIQRFADFLEQQAVEGDALFSATDVETLSVIRGLLAEGYTYEQITHRLQVLVARQDGEAQEAAPLATPLNANLPQAVTDVLHTMADTQQAILNSQTSIRELLGVVVQDNFNLKEENRKLRDRMLELERTLAEYQRREETRKERIENRLRALEGTLGALQQQIARWVEQQRRRRGWFW